MFSQLAGLTGRRVPHHDGVRSFPTSLLARRSVCRRKFPQEWWQKGRRSREQWAAHHTSTTLPPEENKRLGDIRIEAGASGFVSGLDDGLEARASGSAEPSES